MADGSPVQIYDTAALKNFHAAHFQGQPIPDIQPSAPVEQPPDHQKSEDQTEDNLGYYDDGVKRTLTKEQIAMFRNSEIQRLLAARHRAQKEQEDKLERQARRDKRHKEERKKPTMRTFEDEPAEDANVILSYDGAQDQQRRTDSTQRVFLWPQLPA